MPTFTLPMQCGASGNYTSDTLKLVGYSNAAGTRPALLKVSWRQLAEDGALSAVVVQNSDDESTWVTLFSIGDPDTATVTEKTFYTWKQYIRITATYAAGSGTQDAGARLTVDFAVWSLPNWNGASVCRWEDLAAIRPSAVEPGNGMQPEWPDQARIAKTRLEIILRGRGIDPNRLLLDGHDTYPVVEGLAAAGAYLVLALILGSGAYRGEQVEKDREHYLEMFDSLMSEALESGLPMYDAGGDGAPSADEAVTAPPNWVL